MPTAPEPDPLKPLLVRAAGGDEAALAALYDATSARVHGWTLRLLGDRGLAEEATLDVFAQVWREADRHDPDRGPVAAWLAMLARSRALDLARSTTRRRRREQLFGELPVSGSAPGTPASEWEETERAERVRLALGRLPAAQRDVVVAAFYDGLSHSEIAAALKQPLGTVKTRIRSALAALREEFAAENLGTWESA